MTATTFQRSRTAQRLHGLLWSLFALLIVVLNATPGERMGADVALVTAPPGSADYLYTGEQIDPDLGMYYLRARYYQPSIGRFWNMDSFEGSQAAPLSLQKYSYCHGNPINGVDPSGHEFSLGGISASSSIGSSLGSFHNGVVASIGSAMQASITGVMAGKAMNEVLTDYILGETGVGLAVDAFQALRGYFRNDEIADLAIFYQHFDVASLPLLVEDSDYTPTDLDQQEPQCFVAGTMVLTKQGTKAIESIKIGDQVWAYDIISSNRVLKPVVKTFIRQRQDWIKLQINEESVEVTGEHPFFVPGKGWLAAARLSVGDKLLAFDSENAVYVRATERLPGAVTVYNFQVQELHNYF